MTKKRQRKNWYLIKKTGTNNQTTQIKIIMIDPELILKMTWVMNKNKILNPKKTNL